MQLALLGPLSTHSLDELLKQLPAQERADLLWVRPYLGRAVQRLLEENLSQELLAATAADLLRPLRALSGTINKLLSSGSQAIELHLITQMQQQALLLDRFLGQSEEGVRAQRALATAYVDTIVGVRILGNPAFQDSCAEVQSEIASMPPEEFATHVAMASYRVHILLGAALEAAGKGLHRSKVAELVLRADTEAYSLARLYAETEFNEGGIRLPYKMPWYFPEGSAGESHVKEIAGNGDDDRVRIVLDAADFERIQAMIDNPPEPAPALREALLRRKQRLRNDYPPQM